MHWVCYEPWFCLIHYHCLQQTASAQWWLRAGVPPQQLLHFYTAVIGPVLEYASPAWHYSITRAQSQHLESIQKRAVHIIFSFTRSMSYPNVLFVANLDSLSDRRDKLPWTFFHQLATRSFFSVCDISRYRGCGWLAKDRVGGPFDAWSSYWCCCWFQWSCPHLSPRHSHVVQDVSILLHVFNLRHCAHRWLLLIFIAVYEPETVGWRDSLVASVLDLWSDR